MSASPAGVTAEIHGFSHPDATPTPWAAGLQQVIAGDTFWLSTVRRDGRPHVTPLIAVWHGDAIWFTTGAEERKARNLAENPSCILTTGRSELSADALDVVLEGEAEQVTDNGELEPIAEAFATKYGTAIWDFVVQEGAFSHRGADRRALVFRVRPVRGLGFRKGGLFSQTTWHFPG
jgi:nitroimidazol reductase NimA-like FMN-containing flavoprotein (pyridoxamine 5'-phosphate oxidase superfamily)